VEFFEPLDFTTGFFGARDTDVALRAFDWIVRAVRTLDLVTVFLVAVFEVFAVLFFEPALVVLIFRAI
jgi:hypothetical protein